MLGRPGRGRGTAEVSDGELGSGPVGVAADLVGTAVGVAEPLGPGVTGADGVPVGLSVGDGAADGDALGEGLGEAGLGEGLAVSALRRVTKTSAAPALVWPSGAP